MNGLERYLQAFAADTEPTSADIQRLCSAVRARRSESEVVDHLLSSLTDAEEHGPGAAAWRPAPQGPPYLRLARGRVAALVSVAAAVAAAALFTMSPPAPAPGASPAASSSVDLTVQVRSEDHWIAARPARGVEMTARGVGEITGTAQRPHVAWGTGELRVEVDPAAEVDLVVETRESRVHVVGTVFEVNRDLLGTHVSVQRGAVQTLCRRSGETVVLEAGDDITCLPTTAAGMLARARQLEDLDADWSAVLAAAEAGLAQTARSSTMGSELQVVRIQALAGLGRTNDAAAAANAYLESGVELRRAEVERLAAALGRTRP